MNIDLMNKRKAKIRLLRSAALAQKNKALRPGLVWMTQLLDAKKGVIASKVEKAIQTFTDGKADAKLRRAVWKDVAVYLIDPDEYFLYDFRDLKDEEKHSFVGNREKELLCSLLNHLDSNHDAWKIFMDKWQTYERFRAYFKREAILITKPEDRDAFAAFCRRHGSVMVKVTDSSQGRGIYRVDDAGDLDKRFDEIEENILRKGKNAIVEERITQSAVMSSFNESSVNTLRIVTFTMDQEPIIMFSFLRAGRKGAVVDNGGAGGLFIAVNEENGTCISEGSDEAGHRYEKHPDSGVDFIGFQIPEWDKAVALAKELACVVPEQRYVGWDLAYTDSGWVMIEGNSWSQFVGKQISLKTGLREVVDQSLYRYLRKEGTAI